MGIDSVSDNDKGTAAWANSVRAALGDGNPAQSADFVVFLDGSTYKARNGTDGTIDYSGTNAATVIQAVNDALTGGGTILLKSGTYNVATAISLSANVRLSGEWRGDDATSGGTIINRTANVNAFSLTDHFICVENLQFQGDYASDYITVPTAKGKLYFYDLTFLTSAGKGIDLNGSYFVDLKRIRGVSLSDYLIYNVALHTQNILEDITATACNGIIKLQNGAADNIRVVGSDTFTGLTNELMYFGTELGLKVEGVNFEGDSTNGCPVDGIYFSNCRFMFEASRMLYMGEGTDTHPPVRVANVNTIGFMSGVRFDTTKSYKDMYVADAAKVYFAGVDWDNGPQYYAENSGVTAAIATGTAVNHGLSGTPSVVTVTAAESGPTDVYVDTVGATSFEINFGGGGNKTFYWTAEV